jgi:Response regulator of the LytR/AlgR family
MFRIAICDNDNDIVGEIDTLIMSLQPAVNVPLNVDVYFSGERLMDAMKSGEDYHVIILEVKLEGLDGLAVGNYIRNQLNNSVVEIIYVSKFNDYIQLSMRNKPYGYILKPINPDELRNTLLDCIDSIQSSNGRIIFSNGEALVVLDTKSIYYFESRGRSVEVHTSKGIQLVKTQMQDITKQINNSDFLLIHRSYFINLNFVSKYAPPEIEMINGNILPISRLRKRDVNGAIVNYIRRQKCTQLATK